jgi:hypothetical protein
MPDGTAGFMDDFEAVVKVKQSRGGTEGSPFGCQDLLSSNLQKAQCITLDQSVGMNAFCGFNFEILAYSGFPLRLLCN